MAFDLNKDRKISSIPTRTGNIVVGAYSYDGGQVKFQAHREAVDARDGITTVHGKLGRMTLEELKAFVGAAQRYIRHYGADGDTSPVPPPTPANAKKPAAKKTTKKVRIGGEVVELEADFSSSDLSHLDGVY
jgi:hypothetical protein